MTGRGVFDAHNDYTLINQIETTNLESILTRSHKHYSFLVDIAI